MASVKDIKPNLGARNTNESLQSVSKQYDSHDLYFKHQLYYIPYRKVRT